MAKEKNRKISPHPKIAVLAPAPLPFNAEVELCNLGQMVGEKVNFDLIMGEEDVPSCIDNFYNVYHVATPSWNAASLGYALKASNSYLEENNPDLLLNATQLFPLGIAVVLQGKRYGVRTLLRVTGNFLNESSVYNNPIECIKQKIIHEKILPIIYRRADKIVSVGYNLERKMVRAGFPKKRIETIYQPFDAEEFSPVTKKEKKKIKRKIGLKPSRKTILYVGRIIWEKGADRVWKIASEILKKSNNFQFCIVGEGPFRDRFKTFDDGVFLPGTVSHERMHKYFQSADLLIHPSRNEGLPNVILEALACETPVMAAPVGEIDNIITVTSAQPAEYVDYILSKNWVQDPLPDAFDWDTQVRRYEDLFNRAIS